MKPKRKGPSPTKRLTLAALAKHSQLMREALARNINERLGPITLASGTVCGRLEYLERKLAASETTLTRHGDLLKRLDERIDSLVRRADALAPPPAPATAPVETGWLIYHPGDDDFMHGDHWRGAERGPRGTHWVSDRRDAVPFTTREAAEKELGKIESYGRSVVPAAPPKPAEPAAVTGEPSDADLDYFYADKDGGKNHYEGLRTIELHGYARAIADAKRAVDNQYTRGSLLRHDMLAAIDILTTKGRGR